MAMSWRAGLGKRQEGTAEHAPGPSAVRLDPAAVPPSGCATTSSARASDRAAVRDGEVRGGRAPRVQFSECPSTTTDLQPRRRTTGAGRRTLGNPQYWRLTWHAAFACWLRSTGS